MQLILGWFLVAAAVIGGFMVSGGKPGALIVVGEYTIIVGVLIGYVVASSPAPVFKLMVSLTMAAMQGKGYVRDDYLDCIKAIYELLLLAREQGVVAIEEHVSNPKDSSIFQKYPRFLGRHHAVEFLQDAFKPIISGKVKAEQLKVTMDESVWHIQHHNSQPLEVLTKVGDAMPGIGIVAAVLGIIITMASIGGDTAAIGHHVASALVGTFLGILISYGFIQPLVMRLTFMQSDEIAYYEVISGILVGYASGAPPILAADNGRRAMPHDRMISSEELEEMLKQLKRQH